MSRCVLGMLVIEMQIVSEEVAYVSIQLEHVRLRSIKITREPDSTRPLITRPYRVERGGVRKSYYVFARPFWDAASERILSLWAKGHREAVLKGYPLTVEWLPE